MIKIIVSGKTDYEMAINVLIRDKKLLNHTYQKIDEKTLVVDEDQFRLLKDCGINAMLVKD